MDVLGISRTDDSYSHYFAERGAKIVVNDVSEKAANAAVEKIRAGTCFWLRIIQSRAITDI
jgi:lipase chaperone LimK